MLAVGAEVAPQWVLIGNLGRLDPSHGFLLTQAVRVPYQKGKMPQVEKLFRLGLQAAYVSDEASVDSDARVVIFLSGGDNILASFLVYERTLHRKKAMRPVYINREQDKCWIKLTPLRPESAIPDGVPVRAAPVRFIPVAEVWPQAKAELGLKERSPFHMPN